MLGFSEVPGKAVAVCSHHLVIAALEISTQEACSPAGRETAWWKKGPRECLKSDSPDFKLST